MDFRHVKALTIPEGSVKEIRIGNVSIWSRPEINYDGVEITTDNTSAITDFYIRDQDSKTFTATYDVPPNEASITPTWTVSGLPSGLSAVSLSGDSLTISGVAAATGTSTVTIGVTKGSYSDSKQYTFSITDKGRVRLDEENCFICDSSSGGYWPIGYEGSHNLIQNKYTYLVMYVSGRMPSTEANTVYEWTVTGLPDGVGFAGFSPDDTRHIIYYAAGYLMGTGSCTISVGVTRGSYSDSGTYTYPIMSDGYGIEITSSDLPDLYKGIAYSGSITAEAAMPSNLAKAIKELEYYAPEWMIPANKPSSLTYCAEELPDWLSLNSSTGVLTGTPPNNAPDYMDLTLYAEWYPYRSPVLTRRLNITGAVNITTSNANALTGYYLLQSSSITFNAEFHEPDNNDTPVWTVSGLPSGMSAESLSGNSLTVSGYPASSGDFSVVVGVTKGNYSDSKTYTLTITNVNYGVSITTSNASNITDFCKMKYGSQTFAASFNVPPQQENDTAVWSFSGLPSGLSASGAAVSGYAASSGTYTVTASVTKGSYSDSKTYTFAIADDGYGVGTPALQFSDFYSTFYPNGPAYLFRGVTYSGQYSAVSNVPQSAGTLAYYASGGTPGWITLNSSTGAAVFSPDLSRTVTPNTSHIYVYAECYPYRSAAHDYQIEVKTPAPDFDNLYGITSQLYDDNFTVYITAAEAVKSANVGTVIKRLAVEGDNLGSLFNRSVQLDGTALPVSGVSGSTAASGNPKFTVSLEESSGTINTGFYLKFTLTARYTGTAANLKKLSTTHTLTVTNDYGTATKTITLAYS